MNIDDYTKKDSETRLVALSKEEFRKKPEEFRIGAIISDGMWLSLPKWRKLAKVSESEINDWVEKHLRDGSLIQSKTGAKSYRFPLESIRKWYQSNNLDITSQLVDFIFPPRIWDEMTEVEGFEMAPLREIGIVSFICSSSVAKETIESLRGIARVRETEPGKYKAYCLNATLVKEIIEEKFKNYDKKEIGKIYSRSIAKRREIVDFTPKFANGLVSFYKDFGPSLVKREMETIKIFLPEPEDQISQITMWVLTAIEKFDESSSVPFSGYLNSVLKRWPYDLPYTHLGRDLSSFQRQRAKAINKLKKEFDDEDRVFTNAEIAQEMGMDRDEFNDLDEKHHAWMRARHATTLTWEENSDEKLTEESLTGGIAKTGTAPTDIELANKLSVAIIQTAIDSGLYADAYEIISQVDASDLDLTAIKKLSPEFIKELGNKLGV
jgi:DNA-directed RNA polymerase specialized sigma subunit